MNNDLISRSKLKKTLLAIQKDALDKRTIPWWFWEFIDNVPPVELQMGRMVNGVIVPIVQPQGEWEVFYTPKMKKVFRCDKCQAVSIQGKTKFCYNCGVKMKGGAE